MSRGKCFTVENQDRNGIRVRVYRNEDGSAVQADCQCFGSETRLHSTSRCPVFAQQQARRKT